MQDFVRLLHQERRGGREMRAIEHCRNKGNICRIYFIYLIQCYGSGSDTFLTAGSGMEKKSRSGMNITDFASVFRVQNTYLMRIRIRDLVNPGSGMEKVGSGIIIPDPQLWYNCNTTAGIRQERERQAGTKRAEHESDPPEQYTRAGKQHWEAGRHNV